MPKVHLISIFPINMYYLLAIFLLILVSQTISFIPPASTLSSSRLIFKTRKMLTPSTDSTSLSMFGEDENAPKSLTRDNEPDEFFKSKMDDMSDGEKVRDGMGWDGMG